MDAKPDNVVFNVETNSYDASLKEYPTSLGAPVIKSTDLGSWKKRGVLKVNKRMESKFLELKSAYDALMEEFEYNKLIYGAKFSFEPIVGEIYHLYQRSNGEHFLSLLAPQQCNFNFVGSFYLSTEQVWNKV